MAANDRIGIAGMDTRALTRLVRKEGPPTIAIAHRADGQFDLEALQRMAAEWPGLEGMDLAKEVSREQVEAWSGGKWRWGEGYAFEDRPSTSGSGLAAQRRRGGLVPIRNRPFALSALEAGGGTLRPHVVAVDYGNKRNIFRNLVEAGARVTVVPAGASFEEIMSHEPDGFFLSNGPGDPAATGEYAIPVIRQMLESEKPLFGICLGHQLLALAVGGKTSKMFQGHRGANHPVKRLRGRAGRDHQHEPRLRGRARRGCPTTCARPTCRCSTGRIAGSS